MGLPVNPPPALDETKGWTYPTLTPNEISRPPKIRL